MATLFPFPNSKVQVRAMSSANWAEEPRGKGLASKVSKLETTEYPALLFPSKTKLLPSVYQISSGLVWRRKWHPTPVFLPGESCGQRSLVGYCPWGHKESDTTEVT